MKKLLCLLFFSVTATALAEEPIDVDPFTFYFSAAQSTKLMDVGVTVCDKDEDENSQLHWILENSLERRIQQQLMKRGLFADFQRDQDFCPNASDSFYEEQKAISSTLAVNIYKNQNRIFIEMICYKDNSDGDVPFFARTFSVDPDEDEEDDEEDDWWIIVCRQVLDRVDDFLESFTKLSPTPGEWNSN